jgi:hypothetical protein
MQADGDGNGAMVWFQGRSTRLQRGGCCSERAPRCKNGASDALHLGGPVAE